MIRSTRTGGAGGAWLIATGNAHKAREIGQVLAPFGVSIETVRDAGLTSDVEEWGATFAENAVIKALYHARRTGRVVMADDSGLEVDGLGGAPGVRSARYSGDGATDEANNAKLIDELRGVEGDGRRARYRCVIAVVWPSGAEGGGDTRRESDAEVEDARAIPGTVSLGKRRLPSGAEAWTFDGALEGEIARVPRGVRGFGYDPWFRLGDGRHLAELTDAEKNAISHRGEALRKLVAALRGGRDGATESSERAMVARAERSG